MRCRRALAMLADAGQSGCTDQLIMAHGFTFDLLAGLVRAGLATATLRRMRARPALYEWRGVKVTRLVYLQRIVSDRGGPIGTHRKVAYTIGQNFLTLGGVNVAGVHLGREQRRALEMLADAGLRGCTGATLVGHGFDIDMIADLVKDGLATADRETMRMGRRKIPVARVRITEAGRRAIEDPNRFTEH